MTPLFQPHYHLAIIYRHLNRHLVTEHQAKVVHSVDRQVSVMLVHCPVTFLPHPVFHLVVTVLLHQVHRRNPMDHPLAGMFDE